MRDRGLIVCVWEWSSLADNLVRTLRRRAPRASRQCFLQPRGEAALLREALRMIFERYGKETRPSACLDAAPSQLLQTSRVHSMNCRPAFVGIVQYSSCSLMSGVLGSEVERLPPEFRAISTNLAIAVMKLCASGAHGVRSGPSLQKVPRHRGACFHILPWPATEARYVVLSLSSFLLKLWVQKKGFGQ
jgi:hypothetical protein